MNHLMLNPPCTGGNLKYVVVRKRDGPVGGKKLNFIKEFTNWKLKNISKSMAICQHSIEGLELNLNESSLSTETVTA